MEPIRPPDSAPPAPPAPDPRAASEGEELIGRTLAVRYAVTRVLGQGGMGVVVEARHLGMDRPVALKLLHASYSQNRHAVARFEREMKVASRLEHPGCVRVYDVGQAGPEAEHRLFIAMELLRGETLGALIDHAADLEGKRGLAPARIGALGAQIARALAAAHREGIVHRDLKPDNVMILDTPEGELVKVVDFGIARFFGDAEPGQLTAEGAVVGTPTYMSPEQAMGAEIGPASDLYSLGVVLFEMATGEVPFSAPTHVSLMVKHVQEPPPRPSALAPVPAELELLILACLEKDPRARPASALEVARRLDALGASRSAQPGLGTLGSSRSAQPGLDALGVGRSGQPGLGALAADTQRSRYAPEPGARPVGEGPPSTDLDRVAARSAEPPRPARLPLWPLGLGLAVIAAAIAIIALSAGPRSGVAGDPSGASDTSADATSAAPNAPADAASATLNASADVADATPTPSADVARARLDAALSVRGAPLAPEACRLGSARAMALAAALLEDADTLGRPGATPETASRARQDLAAFDALVTSDPGAAAAEGTLARAKLLLALEPLSPDAPGPSAPGPASADPTQASETAAQAVAAVVARCPAWAQGHHLEGRLAQRAGRGPAARAAYRAAIERAAGWGAPRFNLALLDVDEGDLAAAEAGLSALLGADPRWPDAHLVRAETRLRRGDGAGALSDAEAAVAETPARAEAWVVRGAAEQKTGAADRGQASYCRAKALGHAGAAALCRN